MFTLIFLLKTIASQSYPREHSLEVLDNLKQKLGIQDASEYGNKYLRSNLKLKSTSKPIVPMTKIPAIISSIFTNRFARIIIAPIPSVAATISATTKYVQLTASIWRSVSIYTGRLAGKMTVQRTSFRLAPRVFADSMYSEKILLQQSVEQFFASLQFQTTLEK